MYKLILLMLSLSFSLNTEAGPYSGKEMITFCGRAVDMSDGEKIEMIEQAKALNCMAYINGFNDGAKTNKQSKTCIPIGVSTSQIARIYLKDLKNNPNTLHADAGVLLSISLENAFPCENN